MDVSIVICTRNRAQLLHRAISQLIEQDYPWGEYEIVIIDNGSGDQTARVVKELMKGSKTTIRYFLEPNIGVTYARNRGAREAKFPYIAYLDDDCVVQKNWLSNLMGGFKMGENIGMVGGLVLPEWEHDRPQWLHPDLDPYFGSTEHLGASPRLLESDENIVEFNMVIKRSAWQAAGGFLGMEGFGIDHLGAGEGLILSHHLREKGYQICFLPGALARHQVMKKVSQHWLLRRVFWQGAGNAFISVLKKPDHSRIKVVWGCTKLGMKEFFMGLLSLSDKPKTIMHFAYVMAFIGQLVGELHWIGDWKGFRAAYESHTSKSI